MTIEEAEKNFAPTAGTCGHLWFDDGNVVLQAGESDSRFKVYRGILSRESSIFKDMFSLPQPPNTTAESFDGCPLVRLHDAGDSLKLLLSVIFDPNFLDEASFSDHIILLEIAAKYLAYRVLDRLMVIFNHHFPDTLQAFDHWTHEGAKSYTCSAVSRKCTNMPPLDDLIRLVPVARIARTLAVLPALLVQISAFLTSTIVESPEFLKLSARDAVAIVIAQRKLESLAKTTVFRGLFDGGRNISSECRSEIECHRIRTALIERVLSPTRGSAPTPFFVQLVLPKSETLTESGLCAPCYVYLKNTYTSGRTKAWDELPVILDLGTWDEIQATQREALGNA